MFSAQPVKKVFTAVVSEIFIFENVYFTNSFKRKGIGFFGKTKKKLYICTS
jgi:hypothetical protein